MSFWDRLLAEALEALNDPKTIRYVLDEVQLRLSPDDAEANAAVDLARAKADSLAHLAPKALVGLTGTFWSHGQLAAREAYLAHASSAEVLAAQRAALIAARDEQGVWEGDVLPVLKALAECLPQLLPFLLAVVL